MTVKIRIPGKGQYGYHEIEEKNAEKALAELKSLVELGCISAKDFLFDEYQVSTEYNISLSKKREVK